MREKNYDVLAISESWLNSTTTTTAEVQIAGYKITRLDVCMYVNLSLFFPDFLSKQVCALHYMLH